ncbi:hypothetical protein [Aurantimonas endophytica]|jgi:hypothetical protein|nr:hypothetical protein [Aurantimonas endophytica]
MMERTMRAVRTVLSLLGLIRDESRRPYRPERYYMRGPGPACLRRMQSGGPLAH